MSAVQTKRPAKSFLRLILLTLSFSLFLLATEVYAANDALAQTLEESATLIGSVHEAKGFAEANYFTQHVASNHLKRQGLELAKDQNVVDVIYDRSLNRRATNADFFPFYLKFVESAPTKARLESVAHSRAIIVDNAASDIVALGHRLLKTHPELKSSIERMMNPNIQPTTPYVVGEWLGELERFYQAAPDQVEAAKARIFRKASTKGSRDFDKTPNFGGFKNGAGGNEVFQTALKAFVETNFVYQRTRRTFDLEKAKRFAALMVDTDQATEFLKAVAKILPADADAIARLTKKVVSESHQRVRCENLFR